MHLPKLNMLEPGIIMCKAIAILFLTGILLNFCSLPKAAAIFFGIALVTFLFLLILIAIEQHQDHKLYLAAKESDPEIK